MRTFRSVATLQEALNRERIGTTVGLVPTMGAFHEGHVSLFRAARLDSGLVVASLFYFVPNTKVRRRDAIAGGLIAGIALELGKRGFAAYLLKVPTYKAVYGAFAVVPVFLLWVYFSWLVTLTAALVAANLAHATPGAGGRASRG